MAATQRADLGVQGGHVVAALVGKTRLASDPENNVLLPDAALTRDICQRQYSIPRRRRGGVAAWSWHRRLRNNFIAILGPVL